MGIRTIHGDEVTGSSLSKMTAQNILEPLEDGSREPQQGRGKGKRSSPHPSSFWVPLELRSPILHIQHTGTTQRRHTETLEGS